MSTILEMCRLGFAKLIPTKWKSLPNVASVGFQPDHETVFLHYGDTPTLHYYWKNRYPSALFIDTGKSTPDPDLLLRASSILIVRHIPGKWLRALVRNAEQLGPVILFLDDDIPGVLGDPFLPFKYAVKTATRFGMTRRGLSDIKASYLVATPTLAEKYGLDTTSVVPPCPIPVEIASESMKSHCEPLTVFYHGTASHQREIRWLREIVQSVLANCPNVVFEIFGTSSVKELFAGLERVRVVHPMRWQDFFAYSASVSFDIGLAPLLDSPFNTHRSHVKFYDISRTGAVGVYSESPVFRRIVNHGENGLLVPNRIDEWVTAICNLVEDQDRRQQMQDCAKSTVLTEMCNVGDGK